MHPDPSKRYETLSEFTADLRTPNTRVMAKAHLPIAQRNPVAFWQAIAVVLAFIVLLLIANMASL